LALLVASGRPQRRCLRVGLPKGFLALMSGSLALMKGVVTLFGLSRSTYISKEN